MTPVWDGLPDNPGIDGKHWLKHYSGQPPMLREWNACDQFWIINTFGVSPLEMARTERYIGTLAPAHTMARLREPSAAMLAAAVPFPMHLAAEHLDPMDPWYAAMHAAVTAQRLAVQQYWLAMAEAMLKEIE